MIQSRAGICPKNVIYIPYLLNTMAIPELKLPPTIYSVHKHKLRLKKESFFLYEYKPQRDNQCKIV